MKKSLLFALMLGASLVANAQVTVQEPEFVNSYYLLTCESTYAELPKESGTIKKHVNKVSKWSKLAGGISSVAGAAGLVGVATGNSVSAITNSAKVVSTASSVESVMSSANILAGAAGMDIVFPGKASSYTAKLADGDVKIIVKAENNETNPVDLYRIVRFNTSKKERSIQWFEYSSSLLGSADAQKNGYVNFSGSKYGEKSYLLTIPLSSLEEGQYGVFYMNIESALAIPVATFGVE